MEFSIWFAFRNEVKIDILNFVFEGSLLMELKANWKWNANISEI